MENLTEEESNNLITILEDKNISENEYILEAIKEKIEKDMERYKTFC